MNPGLVLLASVLVVVLFVLREATKVAVKETYPTWSANLSKCLVAAADSLVAGDGEFAAEFEAVLADESGDPLGFGCGVFATAIPVAIERILARPQQMVSRWTRRPGTNRANESDERPVIEAEVLAPLPAALVAALEPDPGRVHSWWAVVACQTCNSQFRTTVDAARTGRGCPHCAGGSS